MDSYRLENVSLIPPQILSMKNTSLNWDRSLQTEMVHTIIIFSIATPLNIVILVMQLRHLLCRFDERLRDQQLMFLKLSLQLSVSNLLILLFCCVGRGIWIYTFMWYGGDLLCRLFSFGYSLALNTWSILATAIAIDILFCITRPLLAYRLAKKRTRLILQATWGIAILVSLPQLVFRGAVEVPGSNFKQCYYSFAFNTLSYAFELYYQATAFYIPLVTMALCYTIAVCLYFKSVKQRKQLQEQYASSTCSFMCNVNQQMTSQRQLTNNLRVDTIAYRDESTADRHSPHKEGGVKAKEGALNRINSQKMVKKASALRKLIITAVSIVVTYLITWFPAQMFDLWRFVCRLNVNSSSCDKDTINQYDWLKVFMYTCTITNPFLYKFLRRGYRSSNKSKSTSVNTGMRSSVQKRNAEAVLLLQVNSSKPTTLYTLSEELEHSLAKRSRSNKIIRQYMDPLAEKTTLHESHNC